MKLENAFKKDERVELRGYIYFRDIQFKKLEYQEIQKLMKKLILNQKKTIQFKMSKDWFNKIK